LPTTYGDDGINIDESIEEHFPLLLSPYVARYEDLVVAIAAKGIFIIYEYDFV
jgi:hypothetical protein